MPFTELHVIVCNTTQIAAYCVLHQDYPERCLSLAFIIIIQCFMSKNMIRYTRVLCDKGR